MPAVDEVARNSFSELESPDEDRVDEVAEEAHYQMHESPQSKRSSGDNDTGDTTAEEVSAHVRVHVAKYHIQVQEPKTKKRRVQLKDPEARRLRDNLRNKEHAKVSRLRKKFFVKELEQQLGQFE